MNPESDRRAVRGGLGALFVAPAIVAIHMALLDARLGGGHLFATPTDAIVSTLGIFRFLFLAHDAPLLVASVVATLVALATLRLPWGARAAEMLAERPLRASAIATAALALGSVTVYANHPLAMDEYAPVFQAHVFASGKLAWTFPRPLLPGLLAPGFWNYFLAVGLASGEVASMYWPGHALLLTPFAALGVPWLANPALSGASLVLVHAVATRLTGRRTTGGYAMLLTLASPAFVVNGMSFYAMPAHLALNLLFVWLVTGAPTFGRLVAAGLTGAVALNLHNPIPHALFALPWLLGVAAHRDRWRRLAALALGYLPLGLAVGFGWFQFTRRLASEAGAHVASLGAETRSAADFARQIGLALPGTEVLEARLVGLEKLWLWGVPGLLLLAAWGAARAWHDADVRRWCASFAATFVFYLFVRFDQGHGWGYRYVHSAWAALPLLAAIAVAPRGGVGAEPSARTTSSPLPRLAGALALASCAFVIPTQAWHTASFLRWHLAHRPGGATSAEAVVFVDIGRYRYAVDLVQNTPTKDAAVHLLSRGPELDAALMAEFWPGARRLVVDEHGSAWAIRP